ncbi:MAG: O-antigen ligase family protein [Candidatus Peribacteraceae bacterium]
MERKHQCHLSSAVLGRSVSPWATMAMQLSLLRLEPSLRMQERIAQAVLLAFLVFSILWRGGKSLDAVSLLAVVAWLCMYQFWRAHPRMEQRLPWWLWGGAMLYLLLTIASYCVSSTANYGLDEVLRTGAFIALFLWMARGVGLGLGLGGKVLRTIAMSALAAAGVGYAVYVLQPVSRFVGTFFDWRFHTDYWPNAWGQFVLLAWPAVVWWSVEKLRKPRGNRYAPLLPLGMLLGALLLSYSRGSMLAFSAQLALWAALLWRSALPMHAWLRLLRRAAAACLVALVCFTLANTLRSRIYTVESVTEKATFTADEGTSSVSERRQFWDAAVSLALERPILGWGPYSFRFLQPGTQQHILATSDHPHNVLLKLAMERGIATMLLFMGIAGAVLAWHMRHFLVRAPQQQMPIQEAHVACIAIIGVLLHNMIDYNLQFVGIGLPFWLLLGMLAAPMVRRRPAPLPWLRRGAEGLLMTALLIVAVLEGRHLLLSSLGRRAEAAGEYVRALYWYEQSAAQRFSRDLHLSRAQLWLQQGDTEAALAATKVYKEQNTEDARAYRVHGDICTVQQDGECVLQQYREAYRRNRYNDAGTVYALIAALQRYGMHEELEERREEFNALLDQYVQAIDGNVHFIALSRNAEDTVALTNLLRDIYPEDEPRYAVLGAGVERQMQREREKLSARPPGYLW